MSKLNLLLITIIFCFANIAITSSNQKSDKADTVFKNGNIYTVNQKQTKAEAIAVREGRIVFVGSNKDAESYITGSTQLIDLQGNTVVPGLTDSHCHLSGIGERELTLNLEGTKSLSDFLAKVKAEAQKTPPGKWIVGRGWIETFWEPPVFPTREDLDKVAPNNPVFLERVDGHASVVNSQALKIAGIDKKTTNPFGGEIVRNKQTGEATGMILDSAQELITKHIPEKTETEKKQFLVVGAKHSIELGWCEIQNAGSTYEEINRFKELYKAGSIKLRVYNAVYGPGAEVKHLFKDGPIIGEFNDRFTVRTIKVSFDGALGSKGAALLEPYSDGGESGFLTKKERELTPMFIEALKRGIQVETHAIGDRANREILNIYEKAFKAVPEDSRRFAEPRWRVEHAQILNPTDLPRFASLGVIPSMQPSHAISDLHFAPRRLGIERLAGAYAWQSLLKTGVVIAGGSDSPVEEGNPMVEFYAAVARKDLKGFSGEGWHLEQAVSREDALKMFTLWAAYAAFEEKIKGSIEIGKLADLTVLSADIMQIPLSEIPKTKAVMTVIGGEVVYKNNLKNN